METHFQEISDLKIPVQVVYNGTLELANCRIVYDNRAGKEFVLTAGSSDFAEGGTVNLHYGIGTKAYTFDASVKRVEVCNHTSTLLHVSFPDSIKELERRKFFRVKPSQNNPIIIKLHLPNNEYIHTEAFDVSSSGISYGIPKKIGFIKTGSICLMNIAIPKLGDLRLTGMVRNTRNIFDVTYLGIEFQNITEDERRMLTQYTSMREIEARNENRANKKHEEIKISIVSDAGSKTKYAFLQEHYTIKQIKPLGAIVELADSVAAIIILDCDISTTQILLQTIRKHASLRSIPIMICGGATKTLREGGDFVIDMDEPINKGSFVKMVEKLVHMSLSIKTIKRRWEELAGIGRKILIVDIFNNLGSQYIDYFSAFNFTVIVIEKENTVLEQIQQQIPDFVLFDDESAMVKIIDICRLMNMHKTLKRIPKIFMTKDQGHAKEYLREGLISGYVIKPFTQRQLFHEMINILMKKITIAPPDQQASS